MKNLVISILLILGLAGLVTHASAESEKALFEKGVALIKQEKFQDAIDVFSELITLVPGNPDVYKNRGVAHMKLNQYDLAIQDFEKTREIKPDLKGLYSNLGVAWYYKGDYYQAIKNYNMEIALTPDNYYAYFNRAICRAELEEFELSLGDVNKALELSPQFYLAQCLKGDMLAKSGKTKQAKQAYKKAIIIDPGHPYAKDQLAGLKIDDTSKSMKTGTTVAAATPEPAKIPTKTMVVRKKVAKKTKKKVEQKLSEPKDINPKDISPKDISPKDISPKAFNGYALQAGAFKDRKNAQKIYKKLADKGYPVQIVELTRPSGFEWYLVRLGRFDTEADAKIDQLKLKEQMGMDIIVRPYGRF